MRLQKYLARAGVASRRGSEKLIASGRVRVNGEVVTKLGTRVDPNAERVEVDRRRIRLKPVLWLALNKPPGYACTRHDPGRRPIIYDLLPAETRHLPHVGRLDFMSEGLLLLSNEGDVVHRLLHPRTGVERVYHARLRGPVAASSRIGCKPAWRSKTDPREPAEQAGSRLRTPRRPPSKSSSPREETGKSGACSLRSASRCGGFAGPRSGRFGWALSQRERPASCLRRSGRRSGGRQVPLAPGRLRSEHRAAERPNITATARGRMNGEAGTAQRISGEDLETQQAAIREAGTFVAEVRNELAKRIVGQHALLDRVLMSLLTGGHILLEGVPGLAKTLTVSTLAEAIHTTFRRIQFTPDLLPADVVGTLVWEEKTGTFTPKRGPIFANIVLADEINRAPAKVQSALLEAMQERQVTIGEETHPLPVPFLVMATQNPIEHEGTYPLPEAQVDRFMFKTRVGYPAPEEERSIMRLMAGEDPPPIEAVVEPDRILAARAMLPAIYVDQRLEDYILQLVLATREPAAHGLTQFADWIEFGASPRATIFLARAARAHAFIEGRAFVVPEDVKAIARDVLRHRLVLTFQAQAEQIDADRILDHLLETVPVP